jgi:hypothetical protein
MTVVQGLGVCLLYEFNSGEEMLVRVSELLPMGPAIDFMASKHGGIKDIREPRPAPKVARPPFSQNAIRAAAILAARVIGKIS